MNKRIKKKIRNQNSKYLCDMLAKYFDGDVMHVLISDNKVIIFDRPAIRVAMEGQNFWDSFNPKIDVHIEANSWLETDLKEALRKKSKAKRLK